MSKPLSQTDTLILSTLIILLIGIIGWVVWPMFQGSQTATNTNTVVSQNGNSNASNANAANTNTQPANLNTNIDTSNWKTYRNEELGFEVRYPEGWRVEEIEIGGEKRPYFCPQEVTGLCHEMYINFYANQDRLLLRPFYEKYADDKGSIINLFGATKKYQKLNFEAYEVVKFSEVPGIISSTILSLNTGNEVIEFVDFGENHQNDGIFDSFVYSFVLITQ